MVSKRRYNPCTCGATKIKSTFHSDWCDSHTEVIEEEEIPHTGTYQFPNHMFPNPFSTDIEYVDDAEIII